MEIGKDKIMHLLAGALIALITLLLTGSGLVAVIMATIAGAWKEWWDSKGHGQVEFADFLATAAGGGLAVGVMELYGYIMGF